MRPSVSTENAAEFECLACGTRYEDPESHQCPNCGGELQSLGLSRDL